MDDDFALPDTDAAQLFLRSFSGAARRKGLVLFQKGRVKDIEVETPGAHYSAAVHNGQVADVSVFYDPEEGWEGECSCDQEFDCEHVFAAMSALLAEHRTAVVRSLSSSLPGAAAAMAASRPRQEAESGGDLARLLTVAV